MGRVYFLKDFKKLETASKRLLTDFFPANSEVVVKLHFGEEGNKTALFPKDIEPMISVLHSLNIKVILLDTPVAYDSPRKTVKGYTKIALDRGYGSLGQILISKNYKKIPTKDFTAEVAKELVEAENILVISHVKGHPCAGFGGAIKNLGMGGVSKKTKALEHGLCKPTVNQKCSGCGTCVKLCPAEAIKLVKNKAKVDLKGCWGCSICQTVCKFKAINPKKALFDDLLAQGASAVINHFPKNTFYINIAKNMTKLCDCETDSGKILSKNVGILFSDNPIAIDTATIDIINKSNKGKNVFQVANHKDPMLQVEYASKYTKKDKKYKLELL